MGGTSRPLHFIAISPLPLVSPSSGPFAPSPSLSSYPSHTLRSLISQATSFARQKSFAKLLLSQCVRSYSGLSLSLLFSSSLFSLLSSSSLFSVHFHLAPLFFFFVFSLTPSLLFSSYGFPFSILSSLLSSRIPSSSLLISKSCTGQGDSPQCICSAGNLSLVRPVFHSSLFRTTEDRDVRSLFLSLSLSPPPPPPQSLSLVACLPLLYPRASSFPSFVVFPP